jgi:MFS family permease
MILYPVGGYIADRRGRVKLISYSTYLYSLSHLLFVVAANWQTVAIGQFLSQLLLFYMPAMIALEADSLPPEARGRGFALMIALPGAVRVIAPYMGGWLITAYGGGEEGMIRAIRLCWAIAFATGILVATIRLRYLKETLIDNEASSPSLGMLSTLRESYRGLIESMKWMDRPLRMILLIEVASSFFVAMLAPFWVVYAKEALGLTPYDWGAAMLLSGLVGILAAFPMGVLVDRLRPRKIILTGLSLSSTCILLYIFSGGKLGVFTVLSLISLSNSMMSPAFLTLISNKIPRSRRARLFSILGERGIVVSFESFWGGGFLIFPSAAAGALIGGFIYELNPKILWTISSAAMAFTLLLAHLFVKDPSDTHY